MIEGILNDLKGARKPRQALFQMPWQIIHVAKLPRYPVL